MGAAEPWPGRECSRQLRLLRLACSTDARPLAPCAPAGELVLLLHWSVLNYAGVVKILKKHGAPLPCLPLQWLPACLP